MGIDRLKVGFLRSAEVVDYFKAGTIKIIGVPCHQTQPVVCARVCARLKSISRPQSSEERMNFTKLPQSLFLAKARPEGVLRYASNSRALSRLWKAVAVFILQGLYFEV